MMAYVVAIGLLAVIMVLAVCLAIASEVEAGRLREVVQTYRDWYRSGRREKNEV